MAPSGPEGQHPGRWTLEQMEVLGLRAPGKHPVPRLWAPVTAPGPSEAAMWEPMVGAAWVGTQLLLSMLLAVLLASEGPCRPPASSPATEAASSGHTTVLALLLTSVAGGRQVSWGPDSGFFSPSSHRPRQGPAGMAALPGRGGCPLKAGGRAGPHGPPLA